MKNFSPYTDLALEVAESLTNNADNDLEGLKYLQKTVKWKNICHICRDNISHWGRKWVVQWVLI